MLGEFPEASRARAVLEAVGTGERSFAAIAAEAGGANPLASGTLSPILNMLLVRDMLAIPRTEPTTPLVAVSRRGVANGLPLAAHWGPEDLVRSWQR